MPISFSVEKVSVDSLQVRYADGSYAIVPIDKSLSTEDIKLKIAAFSNNREPFAQEKDVPFKEGEAGEALTDKEYRQQQEKIQAAEQKKQQNEPTLTYKELRLASYPSIGDQLDALYWASNSNPKLLEEINNKITEIKEKFPKTMDPISPAEAFKLYNLSNFNNTQSLIEYLES